MHEFQAWPKTARLFRDIVITEKLDGTNAAVHITAVPNDGPGEVTVWPGYWASLVVDGTRYVVSAQSRKRIITPGKTTDNYGFAAWVYDNAEALVRALGEGVHYGEWWGQGIQRNYGRTSRTFSLFNTARYVDGFPSLENGMELEGGSLDVVPVLYQGPFSEAVILAELASLAEHGSVAAPCWPTPEGICVYHTQTRSVFKVTLDNNDAGKWEVA
ncbi:RNA ligase family protein [Streptomyces sp. NPDC006540]|uniref:RNA ligase family protein n=1 Tax=Streptomyces sp. NPDC006540 TaxID=3155353 RepID=UPI0033ABF945